VRAQASWNAGGRAAGVAAVLAGLGAAALARPAPALAHAGGAASVGSPWTAEPLVLALAALAAALFAQGWIRLRRRGRPDLASAGRAALFAAGLAAAVLPLVSPLAAVADELLSAHMLEHVLIADVSPALLMLAVRGPLVLFLLPAALLGPLARARPLRSALGALARPPVAVALWVAIMLAWHIPAAYDAALRSEAVHDLEHASFVLAGLLVWAVLVDPTGRLALRTRLVAALVLFAAGQAMSDVLVFSFRPYYDAYASQPQRVLGLSPLTDQRAAGLVMMADQLVTLGTAIVLLLMAIRRTAPAPRAAARVGREAA
jgi:putative membrane protein